MTFVSSHIFETDEEEVARLTKLVPSLAKLPVRIKQPLQDLVIQLPWTREEPQDYIIAVVPIEQRPNERREHSPIRIHDGWWTCAVVYSTHKSYSVGGYRLHISEAELVRGAVLNIQHVTYPGGQV